MSPTFTSRGLAVLLEPCSVAFLPAAYKHNHNLEMRKLFLSASLLAESSYGLIPGKLPPCLTKGKGLEIPFYTPASLRRQETREAWGWSEVDLSYTVSSEFLETKTFS